MQSKSTIDNHREISAALDFLRQASTDDGAFELDPRVVSGWVEMCLGALEVLVTAKRGKHADDKALKQTVEEHLDHAAIHAIEAHSTVFGDDTTPILDDDQLPHHDHATARIALLYARKAIVEREKADKPLIVSTVEQARDLFGEHSEMYYIAVGALQNRVTPVIATNPTDKTPNSCKAEKVKYGTPVGFMNNGPRYEMAYTFGYDIGFSPTRPIETDNKPGKAEASCNPLPRGFWTTWTSTMPYYTDESVTTYSLRSDAGNGPWTSCIPNGCPITLCGTRVLWGIYMPPSGVAREGGVAVGVFVNYESTSIKKTAQCAAPKSTPVSFWSTSVGDSSNVTSARLWADDRLISSCINGNSGGTWSFDIPLTFAGVPVPKQKPIGVAMNGARRGELVSVAIGGSGTVTFRDPCHGCSYAKWPNKGPGYSTRCDKCKLDPNRPGYVSK